MICGYDAKRLSSTGDGSEVLLRKSTWHHTHAMEDKMKEKMTDGNNCTTSNNNSNNGNNTISITSNNSTNNNTNNSNNNISDDEILIKSDYIIGADGANSFIRNNLKIPLHGLDNMHTLMNIHFTCRNLGKLLSPRPAMLYFVYNEELVAVFVGMFFIYRYMIL